MAFDDRKLEHRMDTFRRTTLGSILACVLGVSRLANAGELTGTVVSFADLNLDTRDGIIALYARLEAAARSACTAHPETSSAAEIDSCIDYSVRQAVSRIGAPRLIVLYETRSGHAVRRTR
jgi:UrcA family protein